MFASAISVVAPISPAAITDALIWRPGRTPRLGVAVPVVVTRGGNHVRGPSRIAVTNVWIWRPGRTPGLGVAVLVVGARGDNCGRRRSRIDWPATGNEPSAGKARGVVPDHAAPRRTATQHADIGARRHRADHVEVDTGSTAQTEIVGECCCRDRGRGK